MGTGNKINPLSLEVTDIYKTSVCPLAKVMRYELKRRRIKKLKVVYSKETPIKVNITINAPTKSIAYASASEVAPVFSFIASISSCININTSFPYAYIISYIL